MRPKSIRSHGDAALYERGDIEETHSFHQSADFS
jgi:hypothetical protein